MLLYIAATNQVVSSAVVVERAEDGKGAWSAKTGILSQRGPVSDQANVPSLSKASIRYIHDREEAATLL
jgi:hypothetical protein